MFTHFHNTLETNQLWLVNCDKAILEAIFQGDAKIAEHLGVKVPAVWTEFGEPAFRWSWNALEQHPGTERWWGYLPVLKSENLLVGSCGYTGFPSEEGVVEIGYEIAPDKRNQGLATEVVQALVRHAFADARVQTVRAHTLPEENASNRILRKNGFVYVGDSVDPDEGTVWRWELKKQ
jgi:RimJ/RimL family protein N-acetyltransferase